MALAPLGSGLQGPKTMDARAIFLGMVSFFTISDKIGPFLVFVATEKWHF